MSDTWGFFLLGGDGKVRSAGRRLYSGLLPSAYAQAVSNTFHSSTEKVYFEYSQNNMYYPTFTKRAGSGLGLAPAPPIPVTNVILYDDGSIYASGSQVHTIPVPATGTNGVVGVAVGTNQIWFFVNGQWNGSPTANPATNVGGFSINPGIYYVIGLAVSPASPDGKNSVTLDINTGPTFVFPVPAGFAPWAAIDPINPGPPSVSAGSPNPPAPNKVDPGHTKGIRWVVPL
jgi:hypothetical protein